MVSIQVTETEKSAVSVFFPIGAGTAPACGISWMN